MFHVTHEELRPLGEFLPERMLAQINGMHSTVPVTSRKA